jgi:hypothetical protein
VKVAVIGKILLYNICELTKGGTKVQRRKVQRRKEEGLQEELMAKELMAKEWAKE